jgi:hypothetical protein
MKSHLREAEIQGQQAYTKMSMSLKINEMKIQEVMKHIFTLPIKTIKYR